MRSTVNCWVIKVSLSITNIFLVASFVNHQHFWDIIRFVVSHQYFLAIIYESSTFLGHRKIHCQSPMLLGCKSLIVNDHYFFGT